MKYKFFGEPNMLVRERKKTYYSNEIQFKPIFKFDENGEYITEDEKLIEKLKSRFSCVPLGVFKCKYCDYTAENKGQLLAHYKEHKKG